MKLETMSKNLVNIMIELSKNQGLARLLVNHDDNPFLTAVADTTQLINPTDPQSLIHAVPFDVDVVTSDGSYIRVYYNSGKFNENEIIGESTILVDIIVARDLWLINDGTQSLIRPYEIASRVIDMIGRNSTNATLNLKFDSYQHLYINSKFDCLRLYADYMSVET